MISLFCLCVRSNQAWGLMVRKDICSAGALGCFTVHKDVRSVAEKLCACLQSEMSKDLSFVQPPLAAP